MTFEEEFNQQWKSLTNYLVSQMLEDSKTGVISAEKIEGLLVNERKRWKLPGQYQYAWLEKMRREKPDVAQEFESELDSIKLEQMRPASQPSSLLVAGPAAGGAVAGFVLTRFLDAATMMTAIGVLGLGVIGAGVGMGLMRQKKMNASGQDLNAYQRQIQTAGKKLATIAAKADQ